MYNDNNIQSNNSITNSHSLQNNNFQTNNQLNENNNKNKKIGKTLILLFILLVIIVGIVGFMYFSKLSNNENPDTPENNNETVDTDVNVYNKLDNDFESGKITADDYVKYNLYAMYDKSLLGSEYANLQGSEVAIHIEELVNKYYDQLSDETLKYYVEKINLENVTFELNKENKNNTNVAISNLFVDEVYAKEENITNLNKVVLSKNGNFVIWYTTTGDSATTYDTAKKVADGLEATLEKYDNLFGSEYKFNSNILSKGKTYKNQVEILENVNIDSTYLESAMQVYLVNYSDSSLAKYVRGYTTLSEVWNKIKGGDDYGSIAFPYILIKPEAFSDFERLEQLYNHEFFHHYQHEILCGTVGCELGTDPYIGEATANWASSLATNKTTQTGFLNEWAGTVRKYSSELMGKEFEEKYGTTNIGYALFVYMNNYSSIVNNGISKVVQSIYKDDALTYLQQNSTFEERTEIQKNISLQNLKQGYTNKNLLVSTEFNGGITVKQEISDNTTVNNININRIGIDYYKLSSSEKNVTFNVKLKGNNASDVVAYIIIKKNNDYSVISASKYLSTDVIIGGINYNEYDEIYLAISNTSLINNYNYSFDVTKEKIEVEEPNEEDNTTNNDSGTSEFITSINNYNIEVLMKTNMSGISVSSVSTGIIDEVNQKEYLEISTTTMGLTVTNKAYYDFVSGYSYTTQPYGGDVWYKEKGAAQTIDLENILTELMSNKNVTKVSADHYIVKMDSQKLNGVTNSSGTNTSSVTGTVEVDVYTKDGYITKLEYDFTDLMPELGEFSVTINFSNYNKAGNIEIPQSVISGAREN